MIWAHSAGNKASAQQLTHSYSYPVGKEVENKIKVLRVKKKDREDPLTNSSHGQKTEFARENKINSI